MQTITTVDGLAVVTPIWHEKPETARLVRQRIGAVMKWAVAQGFRADNPAGDILGQTCAVWLLRSYEESLVSIHFTFSTPIAPAIAHSSMPNSEAPASPSPPWCRSASGMPASAFGRPTKPSRVRYWCASQRCRPVGAGTVWTASHCFCQGQNIKVYQHLSFRPATRPTLQRSPSSDEPVVQAVAIARTVGGWR